MRWLYLVFFMGVSVFPSFGDPVQLEDFPRGKWLDPVWKAYWVFENDNIRLLDMKDKEIYNFSGIVKNMRVTSLPAGKRITFDCPPAKRSYLFERLDGQAGLRMEITQVGNSISYKMEMPTITEEELAIFKSFVQKQEPESKAGSSVEQRLESAVSELLSLSDKADFESLDKATLEHLSQGLIEPLIAKLEAEAAKPDAPPKVFIALSVLYGRKGLIVKEYAAINAAEASVKPGAQFNIALVYGRKQLIASNPEAESLFVGTIMISSDPVGAEVSIDGEKKGITPLVINKVKTGRRVITVSQSGFLNKELFENIGVGQSITISTKLEATAAPKIPAHGDTSPMVIIPAGTFYMGSPDQEPFRSASELQHLVRLSGFSISSKETTQAEWEQVMGTNPSSFKNPLSPVESISWYDALYYCNKRSIMEGLEPCYSIKGSTNVEDWGPIPGNSNNDWNKALCNFKANGYRLPTEAEWEFAARTGLTSPFSTGSTITAEQANYNGNFPYPGSSRGKNLMRTSESGSYPANDWGLFDMHGNVSEWCWDVEGLYLKDMLDDPTGVIAGAYRVNRGGSWKNDAQSIRSAARNRNSAYFKASTIGFRVVRSTIQE